MSNLRCTVLELVTDAATELNATEPEQIPLDRGELAPIYGKDGVLDSLGLVTFILLVEERLEDKIGRRIPLTDDRALSRFRSPFRTIGSVTDYVAELAA